MGLNTHRDFTALPTITTRFVYERIGLMHIWGSTRCLSSTITTRIAYNKGLYRENIRPYPLL